MDQGKAVMKFAAGHVRGLAQVELDLAGRITAVLGPNRAGKTSLGLALASCLTGDLAPITGSSRGPDKKLMVRAGETKAWANLTDGENEARARWPDGAFKTLGTPPRASRFAAGLQRFTELSPKERAAAFAEIFPAQPSRAELDEALEEADGPAADDALWRSIEADGWDTSAQRASDAAKEIKGQWREATGGATWGSAAGASWRPDGWGTGLEAMTEDELTREVDEAKARQREAVAGAAVAQDRRADLETLAARAPEIEKSLATLREDLTGLEAELAAAREKRAGLGSDAAERAALTLTCPECGAAPLSIQRDPADGKHKLAKITPMSPEELKQVRMDIASADGTISNLNGRISALRVTIGGREEDLRRAKDAGEQLAKMGKGSGSDAGADPAEADQAVARAEADLVMWRRWRRAGSLHEQIIRYVAIAAACGPGGARKKKLAAVLGDVNQRMAELSAAMRIPPVALGEDLEVTMGGAMWESLSGSEKWRAAALVQIEIARADRSAMVILDGADILVDSGDREGLAKALLKAGQKALVTIATTARPEVDVFARAGIGRMYWLENGRAVPVGGHGEEGAVAA